MPSWQDEYLGALQERDRYEKANQSVYTNCPLLLILVKRSLCSSSLPDAKLADRTASLQNGPSTENPSPPPDTKSALPKPHDRKVSKGRDAPSSPALGDALAKVRQDLSEAQRSRGLMETRLQGVTEELQKLKIQSSFDSKRLREFMKEGATLSRGLKDRDEELKGKAKLLEVCFNAG